MNNFHKSVLLQESIDGLNVRAGKWYVDATFGGGGHSLEIADRGGLVLGIDQDQDAVDNFNKKFKEIYKGKIALYKGNFRNIDKIIEKAGIHEIFGVLFDLGVSNYQLKQSDRGFSLKHSGPLDMRMDQKEQYKAFDLVNKLSISDLEDILIHYGEEPLAKKIAGEIGNYRKKKEIATTNELSNIVKKIYFNNRIRKEKSDFATRTFQALRIAVNNELYLLRETLPKTASLLTKGGRLVVISYHSLEDRIVKLFLNQMKDKGVFQILVKKPVRASFQEVRSNKGARSAKLRVAEKI